MFLLTYFYEGSEAAGFLNSNKNGIIPASVVFSKLNVPAPSNMLNIIDVFDDLELDKINDAIVSCLI